jgi:DNA-binding Xre family transcriptional regulator
MRTTMELLDKALKKTGVSERALSQQLGLSASNLAVARVRGNVSPIVAGQLAELVGEDLEHWMAVAVVESQPRSRVTDHFRKVLHAIV